MSESEQKGVNVGYEKSFPRRMGEVEATIVRGADGALVVVTFGTSGSMRVIHRVGDGGLDGQVEYKAFDGLRRASWRSWPRPVGTDKRDAQDWHDRLCVLSKSLIAPEPEPAEERAAPHGWLARLRWCECGQPYLPLAGLYQTTEQTRCQACTLREMMARERREREQVAAAMTTAQESKAAAKKLHAAYMLGWQDGAAGRDRLRLLGDKKLSYDEGCLHGQRARQLACNDACVLASESQVLAYVSGWEEGAGGLPIGETLARGCHGALVQHHDGHKDGCKARRIAEARRARSLGYEPAALGIGREDEKESAGTGGFELSKDGQRRWRTSGGHETTMEFAPRDPDEPADEQRYYILDDRSVVGNCAVWWAEDAKGYTCDLDRAWLVSKEEAESHRETDVPVPQAMAERLVVHHVRRDHLRQAMHEDKARKE